MKHLVKGAGKPSIFDGDGRRRVMPVNAPVGTLSSGVTRAQARSLINAFSRRGQSQHSHEGRLVWVIVTHCIEQGIPYAIETFRRDGVGIVGYEVRAK